jgi:hypothetical protein
MAGVKGAVFSLAAGSGHAWGARNANSLVGELNKTRANEKGYIA